MRTQLEAMIDAHRSWFVRLRTVIEDGIADDPAFTPERVAADAHCELGRWLNDAFPSALRDSAIYHEIRRRHTEFHTRAAEILAIALAGENERALEAMGTGSEFHALSLRLVGELQRLKEALELWAAT